MSSLNYRRLLTTTKLQLRLRYIHVSTWHSLHSLTSRLWTSDCSVQRLHLFRLFGNTRNSHSHSHSHTASQPHSKPCYTAHLLQKCLFGCLTAHHIIHAMHRNIHIYTSEYTSPFRFIPTQTLYSLEDFLSLRLPWLRGLGVTTHLLTLCTRRVL